MKYFVIIKIIQDINYLLKRLEDKWVLVNQEHLSHQSIKKVSKNIFIFLISKIKFLFQKFDKMFSLLLVICLVCLVSKWWCCEKKETFDIFKQKFQRIGLLYFTQVSRYWENSDRSISDFWISGQSFVKENCHNSRISNDIDMKLGQ